MTLRSDEVLIDVKIININLASFNEILDETGEDRALLCQRVLEIVRERGKLHHPVTNSGGMLYGTVVELGPSYPNIYHIRPKDEIISLSSLTVTPLHITRIQMEPCSVFDEVLELDATNLSALCGTPHAEIIQRFDVVINCINTADTEAASLLAVKNHGTIYFATICCDYKFVALTAESIGKEIQVIPYTGFLEGHADYTLGLMRRFPQMQTDIQRGICGVPETISIPNSDETPHAKSEADEDCASGYIFHSLEAKATLRQALKVARYTSNVMIYGESGVGKEIIARIIHQNSERKSFPMVKINCAAIPEHLLESELFGYEKGSFTGANIKGKIGLWEAAQNGTLFLDEVGELPLTFQAKLLRVIQEKEIVRVGGLTPIKVDVRIIAATNRNLARMVQAGEFREDLYYRLNVYPITVLPLRMRRADIIPLAKYFVERYNLEFGLQKSLGAKALEFLENQSFRGNIRELQNLIQRLMIMTNNRIIEARDVLQVLSMDSVEPPSVAAAVPSPDFHKQTTGGSLKEMLSQRERKSSSYTSNGTSPLERLPTCWGLVNPL